LINKTFKQLNAERAGWRAHLKRRSRVFKENQNRAKAASFKRHQKNTKVFKTLQDAIIYNAKERS